MTEPRYLAEYEIESHACLEDDLEHVTLNHPNKTYEVELKNKNVSPGEEYSILTAYIIFNADSLENAKLISEGYIKEYVDLLTFSTNTRFKIGHLLKIADWTQGLTDRECFIYNKFPGDDRPYPFVSNEIIESIESLLKANISPLFRRALKWFSNGVSAVYSDDQFQYFWFVMELLSQVYKKTERVYDLCSICKEPLYCENCYDHPKHRPYPKQAIKYLFSLMVEKDSDKLFTILNDIRNALMHGDDINTIEKNLNIKLSDYVNKLGQIAWISIFNTFTNSFDEPTKLKLNFIQTNNYSYMTLTMNTHIQFQSKDPDNPKIEEIPNFEVNMIYGDSNESNN